MPIKKIEKDQLIKCCIGVFREKGFHHTSIQDLATASGLSKALFYHHFENKDEVLIASLEAYSTYFHTKVFEGGNQGVTSKEQLDEMVERAKKVFIKDYEGCLMANTVLEVENSVTAFNKTLNHFFDRWVDKVEYLLSGNTLNQSPRKLAERSVMLIEGALVLSKLKKDQRYLVDAFDEIKSWTV